MDPDLRWVSLYVPPGRLAQPGQRHLAFAVGNEAVEELERRLVARPLPRLDLQEFAPQVRQPAQRPTERHGLHLASQRAAAHQEFDQARAPTGDLEGEHGDHAAVGQRVAQGDAEGQVSRTQEAGHFLLAEPGEAEIELVGLVAELVDSRSVLGVVLEEIDDHAQAREVFGRISGGGAQPFPLLVRLQVLRAQGGAGVGAQPEQPGVPREDRRRPFSRRIGQHQLYFRRSLGHAASSAGLSSTKRMADGCRLSWAAMERRLSGLDPQSTRTAAKSASERANSLRWAKSLSTSTRSFREQSARMKPASLSSKSRRCSAWCPGPTRTPPGPSSPSTPSYRVWSRSTATTLSRGITSAGSICAPRCRAMWTVAACENG